jgi:hypothetical protein
MVLYLRPRRHLDQAALLVEPIEGQRLRSPRWAALLQPAKDGFQIERTDSRIRVMSSDAPSFYGIGAAARRLCIICDELTQWRTRNLTTPC